MASSPDMENQPARELRASSRIGAALVALPFGSILEPVVGYVEANRVKLFKFLIVTVGMVVAGQLTLALLLYGFAWGYVRANITATVISVMPNYLLNRYWVWGKTSKNRFRGEVLPFWTIAFIGFGVSTMAVWFVELAGWPRWAAMIANFIAYGVVWMFKFFVLERFLFGVDHHNDE